MKRTFMWDFKAVVPIMDFDFRVTVVALQAVRGHILEKAEWPEYLSAEDRIMANFLDLPITPLFLPEGVDFAPFEGRYTSKITELTGFPSASKNFQSDGKTLRDFAEHRLGTSLEGAFFLSLENFHRSGKASIPSLEPASAPEEKLQAIVTHEDLVGISKTMEVILNPQLETGSKIIKMNPSIEQEFPNMFVMSEPGALGKTMGDLISEAVFANPTGRLRATV
ncbi:MAG: hypothetical protein WCI55_13535 [Armatimonadota bacterium]